VKVIYFEASQGSSSESLLINRPMQGTGSVTDAQRWILIIVLVAVGVAIRWLPLGAFAETRSFPSPLTGIVLPVCFFAAALFLAFWKRRT
jgi:hypothetical protein